MDNALSLVALTVVYRAHSHGFFILRGAGRLHLYFCIKFMKDSKSLIAALSVMQSIDVIACWPRFSEREHRNTCDLSILHIRMHIELLLIG